MSQLGAGCGGELDLGDTCRVQGFGRGSQCRAGRDDIVDEQHHETAARTPSPERWTDETVGARFSGLRRTVGPIQEPATGNAQLAGNGLGDRLGLVVAAPAHPTGAGGRPGDHIDVVEAQSSDHVRGKDTRGGSPVTELERDDQLPRHSLERKCGRDAIATTHRAD